MYALGGENPVENKHIRDQFVGHAVDYHLSSCRMVELEFSIFEFGSVLHFLFSNLLSFLVVLKFFVPVFIQGLWWCYAWDLLRRVVFIMDPSTWGQIDEAVIKQHAGTIETLSKSLSSIVQDLFIGWPPSFISPHTAVVRTDRIPYNR